MTIEDKPKTEKWYVWREHKTVEGEETPRLLMPWSDEEVYEHPMNWQFETIAEAEEAKSEFAPDEDWYLVLQTSEVIKRYTPEPCRYCGGNCPREEDNCCDGYSILYAGMHTLYSVLYNCASCINYDYT